MKHSRGQALIEVMIAVSVLTVGFLGVISLLSRALALNRVVAENYTGTYLAAEGIELTKNIIDGNILQDRAWNAGLSDGNFEVDHTSTALGPYTARTLSFNPDTGLYNYSGSEPTRFARRIGVTLLSQDEVRIISEVTWIARGGGTSSVDLEDYFFNWRSSVAN